MAIRSTVLMLACATVLAPVLGPMTSAQANLQDWRFITAYRSLPACRNAGQGLVARRAAREYRCENNYTNGGAPVLDLYVR